MYDTDLELPAVPESAEQTLFGDVATVLPALFEVRRPAYANDACLLGFL